MRMIPAIFALTLAGAAAGASNDAGWYAAALAGTTRTENATSNAEFSEGSVGLGLGIRHGRWFGAQLDAIRLGQAEAGAPSAFPCSVYAGMRPELGLALRGLARLPIGERFVLELGYGYMHWQASVETGSGPIEESGLDWTYSFGAGVRFSERWEILLEHRRVGTPDSAPVSDPTEFSWDGATLRWRF